MSSSECPMCRGQLLPLGSLGGLLWLRCRDCGMEVADVTGSIAQALSEDADGLQAEEVDI